MDFSTPPKRQRAESIVPMINVVFLLLIFFLMTSHLAQPEPFDVTLPEATSDRDAASERVLYADTSGQLAFEDLRGDAAMAAVAADIAPGTPVQLRADGAVAAVEIAKLLRDLAAHGIGQVELVVAAK